MSTLIFDIQTVGEHWEDIDDVTQQSLTRWIEQSHLSSNEKEDALERTKQQLGLSPLTGNIISLAVYDLERALGAVYFVSETAEDFEDDSFSYKARTETELLQDFWESAQSYDVFVSFNGRQFDIPFLLHRSVACAVKPTVSFSLKRSLLQQRMPYHVDLFDELTFYGAMKKRPSLDQFCYAYGIPPSSTIVNGGNIAELFLTKKFRDIALHNSQNIIATTELYRKWLRYLAEPAFLNVLS